MDRPSRSQLVKVNMRIVFQIQSLSGLRTRWWQELRCRSRSFQIPAFLLREDSGGLLCLVILPVVRLHLRLTVQIDRSMSVSLGTSARGVTSQCFWLTWPLFFFMTESTNWRESGWRRAWCRCMTSPSISERKAMGWRMRSCRDKFSLWARLQSCSVTAWAAI
jgi:hypothetical protein